MTNLSSATESPRTDYIACSHCSLPVPQTLLVPDSELQFCCSGCEMVFQMLNECDLQRYYEMAQRERETPDPRTNTPPAYAEFDDDVFHRLYTKPSGPGLLEMELYIEGVHCAACVWLLEKLPSLVPGVVEARLDFRRSLLRIAWNPAEVKLSSIAGFVDRLGYPPHPYRDQKREAAQRAEDRKMLIRIGVAGACAGNTMLIAFALYGGMFSGMDGAYRNFFRWTSLIITLPAVLWAGNLFFKGAWAAIRTRTLHMDLPIALGIGAGFAWGTHNTIMSVGEVYFDSVTTLIFLLLVGRWLQHRQQRIAAQATELLYSLSPSKARRMQDGDVREVPVEALQEGDCIEVRAGDTIPVDGTIRSGQSQLDLSILTGESRPVSVSKGMPVHAGSTNLSNRLLVDVESTGSETRLGQLMRQVEEASQRRAPIVLQADRIAGWFVAAVLTLAVATFVLWWVRDPAQAIEHAVALLIVTCPCALAMATPLAISAGLGKAAQEGILIKGGDVLEALSQPGQLWLDKTGTLTCGQLKLVHWEGDEEIKPLVRAIEERSSHLIARAFVDAFEHLSSAGDAEVEQKLGQGIVGSIQEKTLHIGSPAFLRDTLGELPASMEASIHRLTQDALTPVVIAIDREVKALAGLGDPIRNDTQATLDHFKKMGWRVGILSGDHHDVVQAVARQLGLTPQDCHGGLSPEDKLRFVEETPCDTVVMVGDGVNDAAALSAATIGIGVHGGAEASLAIADIYLTRPGLGPLRSLLDGGNRIMGVIRRGLSFSLIYNLVGATLAITGLLTPLWAAVLMPLSSITVITSSYRARTFGGTSCPSSTSFSPLRSSSQPAQ